MAQGGRSILIGNTEAVTDRLLKIPTIVKEKIVDCSERQLRAMARSGELPFIRLKPKGAWMILESQLVNSIQVLYHDELMSRIRKGEVEEHGIVGMAVQQERKERVSKTRRSNRRKKVSTKDTGDLFEIRGGRLVAKIQPDGDRRKS